MGSDASCRCMHASLLLGFAGQGISYRSVCSLWVSKVTRCRYYITLPLRYFSLTSSPKSTHSVHEHINSFHVRNALASYIQHLLYVHIPIRHAKTFHYFHSTPYGLLVYADNPHRLFSILIFNFIFIFSLNVSFSGI